MKKLLFAFLLISATCFSQEFTFSKIFHEEQTKKLKGIIKIEENKLTFFINDFVDIYEIRKVYENEDYTQYKGKKGEDILVRLTIRKTENSKTILYELKDTFANTYSKVLYYIN